MTAQEYLDLLIKTSQEGMFPCRDEDGYCLYRGPGGRKCAIGLLIPDSKYDPSMESFEGQGGKTLGTLFMEEVITLPKGFTVGNATHVQLAHDTTAREGWTHEAFIARLKKLTYFQDCVFPAA